MKPKIAYFIPSLGLAGAEKLLCAVANSLSVHYEIEITYFKGERTVAAFLNQDIKVHHIPLNLKTIVRLRDYLKNFKPEIVHTHFGQSDFVGLLAALGLGIKTFCTFHNVYIKNSWVDHMFFIAYKILLRIISRSTHVFCISKVVHNHALKRIGLSEERASLLYNAIANDKPVQESSSFLHARFKKEAQEFVVLYAGRLNKVKNPMLLLGVAKQLKSEIPELKILFLGNGPELETCTNVVTEEGMSSFVSIVGAVDAIEPYLEHADVFVSTSSREGFGMVIVEAMRGGVVVVAPDIEGPAEIVKHGDTGLLYPVNDALQMAEQIKYLYRSKENRERLSKNAFKLFLTSFELEAHLLQLRHHYEKK